MTCEHHLEHPCFTPTYRMLLLFIVVLCKPEWFKIIWINTNKTDYATCYLHTLTLSWPAGHICPTYKQSLLQVHWNNSIPLLLHAAIYLEVCVSLFRWTSRNAFSRETAMYKWYCVQCCMQHCTQYHLYTGKWILAGSTFKVDDNMEKKWDAVIPADLKRLFISGTFMSRWSRKG